MLLPIFLVLHVLGRVASTLGAPLNTATARWVTRGVILGVQLLTDATTRLLCGIARPFAGVARAAYGAVTARLPWLRRLEAPVQR
jgi:hypothetical protein